MITPGAYLIGLGLARVTSQMDPTTQIVWDGNDIFHLLRDGDVTQEREYLLTRWSPTPITSPWNGGAYEGNKFLTRIERGRAPRLQALREAAEVGRGLLAQEDKQTMIRAYRSRVSDAGVAWTDACWAELPDGRWLHNPLLGTGGNDGRLEFSRTYHRAICAIMDPETGEMTRNAETWLDVLLGLRDGPTPHSDVPGGQFFGGETVNPWAYLMALEGCLLFGSGGPWRHDPGTPRWPNTAELVAAGGASLHDADREGATEFWWPVFRRPVKVPQAAEMLGSQHLRRPGQEHPRTGLDYARAMATGERPWLGEALRVITVLRNGLAHVLITESAFA